MRKKGKIFLWAMLLALAVFSIWSYYLFSRRHESAQNLKADVSINAVDLYNQYSADEAGSNKKFLNKVIIVKGKIYEMTNNGTAQFYLLDRISTGGVNCQLSPDIDKKKNILIPVDSVITIKGKCTGFLIDVNLVDCVVQ